MKKELIALLVTAMFASASNAQAATHCGQEFESQDAYEKVLLTFKTKYGALPGDISELFSRQFGLTGYGNDNGIIDADEKQVACAQLKQAGFFNPKHLSPTKYKTKEPQRFFQSLIDFAAGIQRLTESFGYAYHKLSKTELVGDFAYASEINSMYKNGDGNGKIEGDEALHAWQHLESAGFKNPFDSVPLVIDTHARLSEKKAKNVPNVTIRLDFQYIEHRPYRRNALVLSYADVSKEVIAPDIIRKVFPKPRDRSKQISVINAPGKNGCVAANNYRFNNNGKDCAFAFWLEDKAKD